VDVASVIASGTVAGMAVAASVATLGLLVGLPAGAAAAMGGGRGLRVLLRVCDLVQALPSLLVVMTVLAAVRAPTRVHVALTFSLTAWAPFCRMAVAGALPLRGAGYVEAARALGARGPYTLVRHVIPGLVSVGGVQWGATAAAVLVSESALAFLGFAPTGTPSLGTLLEQGVVAMLRAPHVLGAAAVAIALASYALIAFGRMAARGALG
jgi:ABC-type dipeptide/oligopeptide/nickel transport system permease subunit